MKKYKNYLGVPDLTLIWYNTQDDNELVYDGIHMDMVDVQEAVYERFCEEYGSDGYTDDFYEFWLKSHLDYIIDEMYASADWLYENKAVNYGKCHCFLEQWKYDQMKGENAA